MCFAKMRYREMSYTKELGLQRFVLNTYLKYVCLFVLSLCIYRVNAQNSLGWNGKKCAVILTYDDAIDEHLDHVIPVLDSLGLRATFYLSVNSSGFSERTEEWTQVAKNDHELGNHTMYHPCAGNLPGRDWVQPDYDLATYSLKRIEQEILATNFILGEIDGKRERTFAYPCGEHKVGDTSYINVVEKNFISARGVVGNLVSKSDIDYFNIDSYAVDGNSADDLIDLVEDARRSGKMLVFMFHGVGGGHPINVDLDVHSELLHYLKDHEKDIWVVPMVDVVQYLKR